jgi:elongation factor Ts
MELNQIKLLREKTGAGVVHCKTALTQAEGNIEEAIKLLRKKGLASAEKKLGRFTSQGIITSYIHNGSKIGVLIEVNCETDFVSRRVEFQDLAHNLAMQIAANENVNFISLNDIPKNIWELEQKAEAERDDLKDKSPESRESILKGRTEKVLKKYTLLNQQYLRDPNLSVEEYIKNNISLFGENIQVKRFCKYRLGEI